MIRRHLPLAGVLLVAAAVRAWGIGFGLPLTLARPDEEAIVAVARGFFSRDLNPHFFNYPTLFIYVVGLLFVAYFKFGKAIGWFGSEARFLRYSVAHQAPFYLIARLLSVAAGVATVWVVFRVALRMMSRRAALVAALFLALSFLHVRDSHFGVTDISATLMLTTSFLFVVRLNGSGARRDLILAAVFAGLAASTKYNAALIVLPACWVIIAPPRTVPWLRRFGMLAGYAALTVAAFVAASPFVVFDYRTFMAAVGFEGLHLSGGHGVNLGRGWATHLSLSLGYGLGTWRLALGVAGFAALLYRNWRTGIMVAVFPVAYYLALGGGYTVFVRYMLPVVPFLCLGGAYALDAGVEWMAGRLRRPSWAMPMLAVLAVVFLAPSSVRIVRFLDILGQTDSRVLATDWIARSFPAGATIGQHGAGYGRVEFPLTEAGTEGPHRSLRFDKDRLIFFAADDSVMAAPDVIVVQRAPVELYDDAPRNLMKVVAARYDLAYFVVAFEKPAYNVSRVYDWQDAFFVPLEGFDGVHRPGPNLSIYVRRDLRPR